MKSNKKILDCLGQKIVENCYDGVINHIRSLRNKLDPPIVFKNKSEFLKSLDDEQFEALTKIVASTVEIVLAEFFNILDEKPKYKLVYEDENVQIDLNKISEMLKAELFIENGWIERFSKFKDNID